MPVIRRKLDPNEVYSTSTRYNEDTDTVQSLVNGEWVDNPAADPRAQTLFPPISTSNPACDAAQRVSDAFEGQITEIITLISETNTFFTIAGAILALFEFGPFGLFIALAIGLAHAMLDAGTVALTDAFTSTVWLQFKCILDCHMGNDGRVNPGEFGIIQSDITEQIGGLAGTILNAMLSIAGEGGVNNLAAIGTATGDCSDCDCTTPCDIDHWSVYSGTEISRNATTGHVVVEAVFSDGLYGGYGLIIQSDDNAACCILSWTFVSGTASVSLSIECGNAAYPTHGFGTFFPTAQQRSLLIASGTPFTLNIKFDV